MGVVEVLPESAASSVHQETVKRTVASAARLRTIGHVLLSVVLAGVVALMTGNQDAALATGVLAAVGAVGIDRLAGLTRYPAI